MIRRFAALSLVVVLAACGGDDDSSTTVTTAAPAVVGPTVPPAAEIPDSFPSEVPLPLMELGEANELQGATSTIYDITGWNAAEPVPLGEAYLGQLRDAGFEIVTRSDTDHDIYFTVRSDDWFVSAGFLPDRQRETGTAIGVTVGPATALSLD